LRHAAHLGPLLTRLQDYPLQPLVDDCRLLGSLLDNCLRIEVGEELFQKVGAARRGTRAPMVPRWLQAAATSHAGVPVSRPLRSPTLYQQTCCCNYLLWPPRPPQIERIRTLSDCAQQLSSAHDKEAGRFLGQKMAEELFALPLEEALPILRAYGHYLK
jgi:phosphoenolpyruvate carboxylase